MANANPQNLRKSRKGLIMHMPFLGGLSPPAVCMEKLCIVINQSSNSI